MQKAGSIIFQLNIQPHNLHIGAKHAMIKFGKCAKIMRVQSANQVRRIKKNILLRYFL